MINRSLMLLVVATLLILSCQAPATIPVEEQPEPSVSVDIIPKTKMVAPGEIITYKTDILNIGVGSLNIAVEHQLIDNTGKVIDTKGEILNLQTQLVVERGFPISLNAENGVFQVKTVVSYADKTDEDRFQFQVFKEEPKVEAQSVQGKTEEQKIKIISEILEGEMKQEELGTPDHEITIGLWGFTPDEITVKVGDIVMWVNTDTNSHTVTGAGFDSGGLRRNSFFKYKFDQEGNYPYRDTYRPSYDGIVHVEAAP